VIDGVPRRKRDVVVVIVCQAEQAMEQYEQALEVRMYT